MSQPFYAHDKSYEENYEKGPFGDFTGLSSQPLSTKLEADFLGYQVSMPFGIPAGPLLNSRFVTAAWNWGFAISTYKTVRGNVYPCHPAPNVIKVISKTGDIHPGEEVLGKPQESSIDVIHDGITNSFGVPSKPSEYWQTDVQKTLQAMPAKSILVLSFMGTKQEEMSLAEYVNDFVQTEKLAAQTKAQVLEVNFSCPNVGKEGLICNDVETSRLLLEAMKPARGNVPLLVKIGYFPKEQEKQLHELLDAIHEYADGVAAINTIQAKVVDQHGKQVLPGSPVRLYSGICGVGIRWAGLEMAERIVAYKKQKGWKNFVTVGVGGVVAPADYFKYMNLGVTAVQSATGAMWQPDLAIQIQNAA